MSHPPLKAVPPSGPLLRQWSNVLYWQDQAALRTYMVDLHQQVLDQSAPASPGISFTATSASATR